MRGWGSLLIDTHKSFLSKAQLTLVECKTQRRKNMEHRVKINEHFWNT